MSILIVIKKLKIIMEKKYVLRMNNNNNHNIGKQDMDLNTFC